MEWNVTGDVTIGTVDSDEELCLATSSTSLLMFSSWLHWQDCMDTCPKYNYASPVTFTDEERMGELVDWAYKVTTDKETGLRLDGSFLSFWLAFRLLFKSYYSVSKYGFSVISRRRAGGQNTSLEKLWTPA